MTNNRILVPVVKCPIRKVSDSKFLLLTELFHLLLVNRLRTSWK